MKVILFRGRSTDQILADSRQVDLIPDDAEVFIICRDSDSMAQLGDVTTLIPSPRYQESGHIRVIANGGTTAQLVPQIVALAAAAAWQDAAEYECRHSNDRERMDLQRLWTWDAWDVQKGAQPVKLAGDRTAFPPAALYSVQEILNKVVPHVT